MNMKTINEKKLNKYISLNNSIFNYIQYDFSTIELNSAQLNLLLYSNYGERIISPIVDNLTEHEISLLNENQLVQLGVIILQMFKRKWDSVIDCINLEYDIINPYRMIGSKSIEDNEHNTVNKTTDQNIVDEIDLTSKLVDSGRDINSRSVLGDERHTTSNTRTFNSLKDERSDNTQIANTGTVTDIGNNSNNDGIFGFNSNSSSGANDSSGNYSDTKTNNLTESHSGTDTNIRTGSYTDNGSEVIHYDDGYNDSHTISYGKNSEKSDGGTKTSSLDSIINTISDTDNNRNESSNLHGNIGNHSNQELLNEEFELWKRNFLNQILNDVASVLTIDVYC